MNPEFRMTATCSARMTLERELGDLLGIRRSYVHGCVLPVGRLRGGHRFTPAPRRRVDDVIGHNGWES